MSGAIPTSVIYTNGRARPLVPANIERLKASMASVGLINPLMVRPISRFQAGVEKTCYEIIAGGHRFQAAKDLGWETIDCRVIDGMDDLKAELAEIDENIMRENLSPVQASAAYARRKEIYVEMFPETRAGGDRANAQFAHLKADTFSEATAQALGRHRATIDRAIARHDALGPDLEMLVGTSLDKGSELDALSKLSPDERKPLIDRARAGEVVSAKPVKIADEPLNDFETKERWMGGIMAVWNRGSAEWREEFLSRIDKPIMDRRYA